MKSYFPLIAVASLTFAVLTTTPGCEEPWNAQKAALVEQEHAAKVDELTAKVAAAELLPAEKAAAVELLAQLQEQVVEMKQVQSAAVAKTPTVDTTNGIIGGVSTFAPPPWNVLLASLATGIASFFMREPEAKRLRVAREKAEKIAGQIVASIDKAKMNSPEFKAAFAAQKMTIRAGMDDETAAEVAKLAV